MKSEKQLYHWDVNQYLIELQPTAEFIDYPMGNEVIRIKTDGKRCRIPDEVLQTYGGKTCYERYPDGTYRAYSFSVLYAPPKRRTLHTQSEHFQPASRNSILLASPTMKSTWTAELSGGMLGRWTWARLIGLIMGMGISCLRMCQEKNRDSQICYVNVTDYGSSQPMHKAPTKCAGEIPKTIYYTSKI